MGSKKLRIKPSPSSLVVGVSPLATASQSSSDGGSYRMTNSEGLLEGKSVGPLLGIVEGAVVLVRVPLVPSTVAGPGAGSLDF